MIENTDELPSLPNSWAWTRLEEIGIVASGGTPSTSVPEYFEGDVPWITPADLSSFTSKFIQRGRRNISEKGLHSSSAVLLPAGTILFSSRAPIGYVAIAANPIATNQGFKNLVLCEGVFNEYVFHYLKASKKLAESYGSGTTFREVSASRFRLIPIPLAPYNEQRRIVVRLEELFACLDAGVEGLRKVKAQLKRYRQAVLKYAFEGKLTEEWRKTHIDQIEPAKGLLERVKQKEASNQEPSPMKKSDLFTLPKDWIWTVFGEISRINMGQSPSGSSYNNSGHGTPLLNGPTEFGEEYPVAVQWTTSPVKICKKGDLLICVRGNTTGRMNWADQEYCIGRGLAAITPLENIVKRELLFSFLLMKVEEIMRRTRGSTFPNLKSDELHKFPFPLAAYTEQEELVVRIGEAFSAARELERNMATSFLHSERLRQSILKASFEGELVPQDPSDEPAEKLLERVKAERAKAMGEKDTNRRRKNMSKQLELSTYVK